MKYIPCVYSSGSDQPKYVAAINRSRSFGGFSARGPAISVRGKWGKWGKWDKWGKWGKFGKWGKWDM